MKVKRLTKQTAEKIAQATEYAEQLTSQGDDALSALVKAADKYDLNNEQAHLLVRGWNVSQIRNLFTMTKDAELRLQDLDIVDIHTFDNHRKTKKATTKQASTPEIWPGYLTTPDYQLPEQSRPNIPSPPDPSLFSRSVKTAETIIEKRYSELKNLVKLAKEELDRLEAELLTRLDQCRRDIFDSALPPDIIADNLKVAHPKAYQLFQFIQEKVGLEKRADYTEHLYYDSTKIPYRTLISCSEFLEKLAHHRQQYQELVRIYKRYKDETGVTQLEENAKYAYLLDPTPGYPNGFYPNYDIYNPPTLLSAVDAEIIFKKTENLSKQAQAPGPNIPPPIPPNPAQSNILNNLFAAPSGQSGQSSQSSSSQDDEKERRKALEELRKQIGSELKEFIEQVRDTADVIREFEAKTQNDVHKKLYGPHAVAVTRSLKLPGIVTTVIAKDPILINYDPEKVAQAYNYLHEIAPTVMQNPAVAREYLRKYLEQGEVLDSYDMKLLVDMEAKATKRVVAED